MINSEITEQIHLASARGKKRYSFEDKHDEKLPADMWFQTSEEGLILFIVFYSQACRWSQCLGCNLPQKMSDKHVSYKALVSQIDYVFNHPKVIKQRHKIGKVIISNNGSIFDQATFSSMALMYFLVQLNFSFTNLAILSIESRIEYIELAELEFISRALAEGDTPTNLEIAIGFEAFDDYIRNTVFKKGLSLQIFQKFVNDIAPFGYFLKCYFMQKPVPGMSDEQAIADIHNAIDYLSNISDKSGLHINMHLNPTFVAKGTLLEESFYKGQYSPPFLTDVAKAALYGADKSISIFIGLNDEGLAVEGGSFIRRGDSKNVQRLELFNRTQDYSILENL